MQAEEVSGVTAYAFLVGAIHFAGTNEVKSGIVIALAVEYFTLLKVHGFLLVVKEKIDEVLVIVCDGQIHFGLCGV